MIKKQKYHFGQLIHIPGHKKWVIRIIRGEGEAKGHSRAEGDLVIRGCEEQMFTFVHHQDIVNPVLVYVKEGSKIDLSEKAGSPYGNPKKAEEVLRVLYLRSLSDEISIRSVIFLKRLDAGRFVRNVLWSRDKYDPMID